MSRRDSSKEAPEQVQSTAPEGEDMGPGAPADPTAQTASEPAPGSKDTEISASVQQVRCCLIVRLEISDQAWCG